MNDALFNLAHANAMAAAPSSVKDEVMAEFIARRKRQHPKREPMERSLDDINAEELANFDRAEAGAINRENT